MQQLNDHHTFPLLFSRIHFSLKARTQTVQVCVGAVNVVKCQTPPELTNGHTCLSVCTSVRLSVVFHRWCSSLLALFWFNLSRCKTLNHSDDDEETDNLACATVMFSIAVRCCSVLREEKASFSVGSIATCGLLFVRSSVQTEFDT